MVEVLDGFSKRYSFSYEDVVMNSIGVGTGWLLQPSQRPIRATPKLLWST